MELRSLEKLYKAVANKRRLALLQILSRHRDLSVMDLADKIKLTFRSTSKHLQVLAGEGLVEPIRSGTYVAYRISSNLAPAQRRLLEFTLKLL